MHTFNGKKVLITGINGFMGSHLAQALRGDGAQVYGLTRNPHHVPFLEWNGIEEKITLIKGDIRTPSSLEKAFQQEYDAIFHLASQSDTWKSGKNILETFDVNVTGTLHLLEAIRQAANNPRVIVGGSVRVFQYGKNGNAAGDEVGVVHPYDASKVATEVMASSYFHTYGINGAVARNTNAYGPNDLNFSRLIPLVMKGALTEGVIRLRGDGKLMRDFMHVEDAVSGMRLLAEKVDQTKHRAKAYTFATGTPHSVSEVVSIVRQNAPRKVTVEWDTRNPMQDRDQIPIDISGTQSALGWKPTFDLAAGIRDTLNWYVQYFEKKGEMKK